MALNFKNLPNVGDTIIVNNITYVWDSSNRWFTNFPGLVVSTGNAYKDVNGVWWIASPDIGNQGDFVHGDLIFPSANIYFSMSNGIYGIYFDNGNSSITFSNGQIQLTNANVASGGGGNVAPAFIQANTARDQANAAYAAANAATGGSVGAAYGQANTARDTANLAFNNSNVAGNFANAAATAAYASVNNVSGTANTALNTANLAFNNSNVAGNFANAAATAAYNSANAISATANVALNTANLAYAKAQSAVQLGFTAIAANGNGATVSASSNNDTLIFANTGNVVVTANAAGGKNLYIELTTTGVTAAAYGNALFGATFTVDSRGRIVSASPVLMGDAIDAYNTANAAFAKANSAAGGGLSGVSANTPTGVTLTPTTLILQNTANIYVANTGTTNIYHELTTTGVTAGAYGNAMFGTTVTIDSRGRVVSAAPVLMGDAIDAYNTANSAFAKANAAATLSFSSVAANGNGVVITAASSGDTLIFANTGNVVVTANSAGGKNLYIELTTTGVTAASYGNALFGATFTVDSRGRIVSASPVLMGDAIDAYNTANSAFAKANAGGGTVNSGASLMFSGGSNSAYYFTGYSPKSLTIFGARTFVQMAGEIGRCANINIAINGTVVTGLTQMFANTLNTKALTLSTGSNSVVSGDIITAVVANNTVDSGNNIVVAIQLQ